MEKEILLNDQGYKYRCIIDKDNISFDFDKNISFLEDLIRVEDINDSKFVYLGLRKILKVQGNNIERILPITTTEIRILRAIYNHKRDTIKSKDIIEHFKTIRNDIEISMHNYTALNKKAYDNSQKLKAEFHTNLMDILSPREFIEFVNKYNITYPINSDGEFDLSSDEVYTYKELVFNEWDKKLEDSLCFSIDNNESNSLEKISKIRRNLLKRAVDNYSLELSMDKEWNKIEEDTINSIKAKEKRMAELDELRKNATFAEKKSINKEKLFLNDEITKLKNIRNNYAGNFVYNDLLDSSIEKFEREGVEYSEISFSNESKLKYMSEKHKDIEKFKLLFSIDKSKSIIKYADAARTLESLLSDGVVIGTEILGFDSGLDGKDYSDFKEKIEWILPVLHICSGSVLRLHAGSDEDATLNILNALKAIKETENKINESCSDLFGEVWGVLPPPRIRIGSSLDIEGNKELVDLIHEFDAVIEFNVTENYSLNRVDDLSNLPIKSYDENNIKYIFSTGGGGVYRTSINQEENIINNIQTTNETPTKQVVETNFVKESEKTENELINDVKENEVNEEDKELMDKFLEYKEENLKKYNGFKNYNEAMEEENKIFASGKKKELKEIDKVKSELKRIKTYIKENDIEIDDEYFKTKINVVEKYSEDKHLSEYAKMYLFLLERELFPEIDTPFKTMEYLSTSYEQKDRIEEYLKRVLLLVSEQYVNDSEEYNKYHKKIK